MGHVGELHKSSQMLCAHRKFPAFVQAMLAESWIPVPPEEVEGGGPPPPSFNGAAPEFNVSPSSTMDARRKAVSCGATCCP